MGSSFGFRADDGDGAERLHRRKVAHDGVARGHLPLRRARRVRGAEIESAGGERQRHRLSRSGDRQLNSALHLVAVTQVRMTNSDVVDLYDRVRHLTDRMETLRGRLDELVLAQERLRGLLDAVVGVGRDLSLEATLQHIVDAASTLVGARYGALGVLDEEESEGKRLGEFVTYGITAEQRAAIGTLLGAGGNSVTAGTAGPPAVGHDGSLIRIGRLRPVLGHAQKALRLTLRLQSR